MATRLTSKTVAHPGSILVLAGAGTGKTSTLTAAVAHRIAVDKIPPHRVLAVTFTNKAAGEMAGRIRAALGPDAAPHWLGTFHGLAARQLRAGPEVASLRDNFDILDADDFRRILRRIMKAMNLSNDEDEGGKRDPVKIVASHIGKFKDLLMTPKGARSHVENRIAEGNRTGAAIDAAGLTMAAKVYQEYQTRPERPTRPTSATCSSGRRWLWSTTPTIARDGQASSTGSTRTSIRTSISHSTHG